MTRGDQIYVFRPFLNLDEMYEHHGIDCGDGTVIHYRKPTETIERTSREIFAQGKPIYVKKYPTRYIAETTVQRAESRLGERQYNLFFNNCEHFATWCVTGVNHSQQVHDFLPILSQINLDDVAAPFKTTIFGENSPSKAQLINQALADIRTAWEQIHPQFQQAKQETETWQNVARLALQKNREDLAKSALLKKREWQKRLEKSELELQQLAQLTENILRQRQE